MTEAALLRYRPAFVMALAIAFGLATGATRAAFPITFQDDLGHTVTIPAPPQRIISLAPSNTEILFALGLEPRIVAVDSNSNYPPAALQKPNVGSGLTPSLERIVALRPDLVLLWDLSARELQQKLSRLHITTAVFAPANLAEVYECITTIGRITATEQAAAAVVADMKSKVAAIVSTVKRATYQPLVLYEVWPDPLYSAGPGGFIDELINLAGGRNVAYDAKSPWPVLSVETVITRNPDVILTTFTPETSIVSGKQKALWANVKAVRNGRIVTVSQDIVSRPGPRLADGLAEIAKALHPQLFR